MVLFHETGAFRQSVDEAPPPIMFIKVQYGKKKYSEKRIQKNKPTLKTPVMPNSTQGVNQVDTQRDQDN